MDSGQGATFDLKLLKRFTVLARPYWFSDEKSRARGMLALMALLLIGDTVGSVLFNKQSGEFTSALAAGDGPRFRRSVMLFCGLLAVAVPIYSWYYFVRDKLAIEWRRWMTGRILGRYFHGRQFYRLLKN